MVREKDDVDRGGFGASEKVNTIVLVFRKRSSDPDAVRVSLLFKNILIPRACRRPDPATLINGRAGIDRPPLLSPLSREEIGAGQVC